VALTHWLNKREDTRWGKMSLSNRNTTNKTDYASIEGGYDGSRRPPRRTDSVMDKLHQFAARRTDTYFSPAASRQQVCAYILSALVFLSTTCIVLFEPWLRPACDEALVDAIFPKHDAPFVNPHYDPGCRNVRYIQLLNLTQRECDLGRRILFSILCGGAVGYERRRGDRPAGIRTMALVALGACIFTITSLLAFEDGPMAWDSSRVAAAIPSGAVWKSSSVLGCEPERHRADEGMAWKLHAIEQMQLRGRRRVDGVGRPEFDFHTGRASAFSARA
jgi:hypothetical protein